MIATAIGKPKTRATPIVDVTAESKFIPPCTLSNPGMIPLHGLGGQTPSPGQNGDGLSPHTRFQKGGRRVPRHG